MSTTKNDKIFFFILLAVILPVASLSAAGTEDLGDLARFASYWLSTNCSTDNFCGQWDMDHSGSVNASDLAQFAEGWLTKVPVTFTYCFDPGYLNSMPVGTDRVRVTISGSASATQDILRSNVTDPSANGFTTFLLLPGSYSYTAQAFQNNTLLLTIGPINITVVAKYRLSIPLWPALNTFDMYQTTSAPNTQMFFGTDGSNRIVQYGPDGNDILIASGSTGSWIEQYAGTGNNILRATTGDGNVYVYQQGGVGPCSFGSTGGTAGMYWLIQKGATGVNTMEADYSSDKDGGFIVMIGGDENDTITATGSSGDNNIIISAQGGNDSITYNMTNGTDAVFIDGGGGNDTLESNTDGVTNFKLQTDNGQSLYLSGSGRTTITVKDIEHITILNEIGYILFQWNAP